MYERIIDGRTLTFGHAGMLYQDSFVLYDHETESLWVQVTGRAEKGPLRGARLTPVPATLVPWSAWKASYPHTRVLAGTRDEGFMGSYRGVHRIKRLGLSLNVRFQPKLYPFPVLAASPVVNDLHADTPVLVVFAKEGNSAAAWERRVAGRVLRFHATEERAADGHRLLADDATGSRWHWLTGQAVAGPLRGHQLPRLSHQPILIERFRVFYPEAPIHGEP